MFENTKPRNINNLSKRDAFISPGHDFFWQCWIHAKLNFQCVHANISRKQTVNFHNTPTHAYDSLRGLAGNFPGNFLACIGSQYNWGPYHRFRNCAAPKVTAPHQSLSKKIASRWPGVVSMRVPQQFRAVKPALTFTSPEVCYIKLGWYSSIDDIMDAIFKGATRNYNEKLLPRTTQHLRDATWRSTNISWKVDKATIEFHVKFWRNVEQNGLVIGAKPQDLKTILGLATVVECQHGEQRQESKKNFDGNCQDDQQNRKTIAVVKNSGQWPVDLKAGSHTILLYCDLVQNEILGDTQTALLRSISLENLSWTDQRKRKKVNHRSFSNLQWKRTYISQFQ